MRESLPSGGIGLANDVTRLKVQTRIRITEGQINPAGWQLDWEARPPRHRDWRLPGEDEGKRTIQRDGIRRGSPTHAPAAGSTAAPAECANVPIAPNATFRCAETSETSGANATPPKRRRQDERRDGWTRINKHNRTNNHAGSSKMTTEEPRRRSHREEVGRTVETPT